MVRVNILADALKTITNAERAGKRQVMIRPASKVICEFLNVMMKHQYITDYTVVDNHRSGKIVVNLNGRLNKCAVISPRYNVPLNEFDQWEANLLPSRHFGAIVLTTSYGIMDNAEARRKHTGGKILGFFY
ncbi:40S ribosomal protein S15a [Entamoeba marina]